MPRCPVCNATVNLETTPTAPFCTDRCQTVDLGRWLQESYGLPEPNRSDEDDAEESASAQD